MKKILLCMLSFIASQTYCLEGDGKQPEELITFKEMIGTPKSLPQTDTDEPFLGDLMLPKPPVNDSKDYDNLLAKSPVKFRAALRQQTKRTAPAQPKRRRNSLEVTHVDMQRNEIQESIETLHAINQRLVAQRAQLDHDASIPWNSDRKKRLVIASFWTVLTGAALGGQAYILHTFSPDTRTTAAVSLAVPTVEALRQSIKNITDVVKNTPIDEKLEENNTKIEAIKEIKQELLEEIGRLQGQDRNLQDRVSALEARIALGPLADADAE